MLRSHLSIWNQFLWKILSQKVHFVCFWKCWAFKLSITPPYYSLTTMHSTLHSVHHRKTGRETISLKLNDPLKNRYEPSRRSLNRKQRLFLYPQSFAVPRRVSFFIIYMPHFLPRFHEVRFRSTHFSSLALVTQLLFSMQLQSRPVAGIIKSKCFEIMSKQVIT